ncbi:MAG: polysaccharide biosynthesis protein [Christensenellales bacterium]|mgnify:CR=1 FL=1|jgi:polysaccharide biosynthesis protein capD
MGKVKHDKPNISRKKRIRSIIITLALDICFAALAFFLARTILFFRLEEPAGYAQNELAIAVVAVVVTVAMLVIFDCYNAIWRYAGRVEFFKFLFSYIASFFILFVFKIILEVVVDTEVWVPLILIYLLFSAIFSGTIRFFYGILHYLKHVRYWVDDKSMPGMKRTIVIGAGYTGSLVINRFINNPGEGYYPVAVVDDDEEKQNKRIYGISVEGGVDKLAEIVERHKAEAFVIAIMSITKSQLRRIYNACAPFNLPIKIMPSITNASEMADSVKSLRDIKIEELLGRDEFKVRQELIDVSVKDKVVMVTGGAGSIGSELCRQVLNFGCRHLIIFDQHENGMFFLNQEFVKKYDTSRYTLVMGTVRERDKLSEVMERYRPDIIFHAAAYKHVPMMEISATEAIKNNVFGTLNVIECAEKAGVKKFVLISTDKAVNPTNIMGASKRIAEMLIETRGKTGKMKMAAVRFGNVLGSNGSVIPIFLQQIKEGGPITLTDRNIKRYFMSIPEAVRLVLQTGAFADSGEIFVLDMGEPVYIYDLACDLIRINGLVPEQDIQIKVTGLRPGEKMFEELRYDTEAVDSTLHEGVFVNRLEDIDRERFDAQLEELRRLAFDEDAEATTDMIFSIVPSEHRKKCVGSVAKR